MNLYLFAIYRWTYTSLPFTDGPEPLYLPDEDDDFEQFLLTWINESNLTYSLLNGALIGMSYLTRLVIVHVMVCETFIVSCHSIVCKNPREMVVYLNYSLFDWRIFCKYVWWVIESYQIIISGGIEWYVLNNNNLQNRGSNIRWSASDFMIRSRDWQHDTAFWPFFKVDIILKVCLH